MRYILLLLCCAVSLQALSQQQKMKEEFYLFDQKWETAKDLDHASYFMQMIPENDSLYICRYYNKDGPMIKQESFLDADLAIPNGRFAWYNKTGGIDSTGMVWRSKKDGYWLYYNDTTKATLLKKYDKGKWLCTEDRRQGKTLYADGRAEAFTTPDTTGHVAAAFPGGIKAWTKYLEANIEFTARFKNLNADGAKGIVVISFVVEKDGSVRMDYVDHSCEYSLDAEAIRTIKASPKWIPATDNGNKVIYRQKQGFTFNYGR